MAEEEKEVEEKITAEENNDCENSGKPEEKKKKCCGKKSNDEAVRCENETLKKENEELKDRHLRLAAEFDNYKKRTARENEARYSDAKADTIKKILPVIDNFERAIATEVPEDAKAYADGVNLIYNQFMEILKANGVEEIPAKGEPFNPNYHNAVMHIDDETLGENVVAEVFEKGYKMGDRVLRHSMVKVAN